MKVTFRHIAAAAALVAANATHAEVLNASPGSDTFTGSATLKFSGELLGAMDVAEIRAVNFGDADSSILRDNEGLYASISATAPLSRFSIDTVSSQVLGVGSKGGLTLSVDAKKSVSIGGTMTVTDLSADLNTHTIFATIIGANNVGTVTNVPLWTFSELITGTTLYSGPGEYNNTLSGLVLTTEGYDKFVKSLGLLGSAKSALKGLEDFGTIESHIDAHMVLSTVPEPATYILMGLGLMGMGFVSRRQSA